MIDSYAIVQRTLDEANDELRTSLTSAKIAADSAARRVEAEPMPSQGELEREIDAARDAGLTAPEAGNASERPAFADELPHEDMVPLERSEDFEAVRIVKAVTPDAEEAAEGRPRSSNPSRSSSCPTKRATTTSTWTTCSPASVLRGKRRS